MEMSRIDPEHRSWIGRKLAEAFEAWRRSDRLLSVWCAEPWRLGPWRIGAHRRLSITDWGIATFTLHSDHVVDGVRLAAKSRVSFDADGVLVSWSACPADKAAGPYRSPAGS